MACIKSAPRSALAAFAPDAPYLAAGTMAGAVDLSFSSSANLEIFKLDFQSDRQELPVVGGCPSSDRFNRLSWGKPKSGSTDYSLGLIAGGLGDGTISVWNPAKLIGSEENEDAFVVRLEKHTGPVRGLEFNPHEPKLLASGADEGELCIWDLENPSEPKLFPSLKSVGSGSETEISFLSWNAKYQHVVASTSYNGITVVWDLRQQKPLTMFVDPGKRRCSVLQWNPEVSTQLIVASDDDSSPALRVWDVRKTISPVREFVGHTKGVIAMSWCPYESSLLLTCAKDNRTICWDTNTGEIHSELPASTNWNFDIHWHPKIPGVISASSFDVKLGIYNTEACNKLASDGNLVSTVRLRAPKWLSRPVGVSFGFGGKLATFHPSQAAPGASSFTSEVHLHNLVTEDSLVNRSAEFEAAIQSGERNSLRALCEKKSQDSLSDDEKEVWAFLKVMFEEDGTARTKLLTHLGFRVPNVESEVTTDELGKELTETLGFEDNVKKGTILKGCDASLPIDNEDEFFNNPQPCAEVFIEEEFRDEKQEPRVIEPTSDFDSSIDEAIQSALVVGDYKEAVWLCMSANRVADALVIAHVGGPSLWEGTRDKYLQSSPTSYLKIVAAMATNDLMTLVSTRPLNSWKETLALLCTFAQKDEWIVLCDTLGSRLLTVGNTLAASLCYICAENIDKIVEIWSRSLMHEQDGRSYVDLLQDVMEKIIVLSLASGQKRLSKSLSKLVENYAEILASQGLLSTAMEYLQLLGSEDSSLELTILRDRVALCTEERGITSLPFEGSPQQHDHVHNIDGSTSSAVNGSQHYYQDNTQVLQQQPTSSGQYGDGYQPNLGSYGGYPTQVPQQGQQFLGYTNPVQYQPTQSSFQPTQSSFQPTPSSFQQTQSSFQPTQSSFQPTQSSFQPTQSSFQPTQSSFQPTQSPHMFIPSQTQQVPQQNYGQPPAPAQPVVRPFVPTNPPALRNADQYQQPHTLGSQLYPGVPSQNYQTGTVPTTGPPQPGTVSGHRFPQPGIAPAPRSFMPVTSSSFGHTAGFNAIQPSSPTQNVQQPVAVLPAPLPTVQTVDTTKVSAELRPVIGTLTRLYQETSEALGGQRANPAKKREIEDNSRKIGALFAKLNNGDISLNASSKLRQLCQALDTGDFASALHIQVLLTTSDWDECNFWLAALKRMIKTRQNVLM